MYKWYEIFKILDIKRQTYTELRKRAFPNDQRKNLYSEADVEILRQMLHTMDEEKKANPKPEWRNKPRISKEMTDFELAGENEFYAKIVKDNEIYSMGVFNSTNLSEDIRNFKFRGMDLIIIEEKEAKKIYKDLYCFEGD